ncbi:hypothetical protein ACFVFQ_05260 [Streptomyces sp. NPDC057743]|uniref:hypothetical protein n=1 Tax=Streptomyces sp. NPDC057743 TaxID=3346236 RepID=UPI0036A553E6
MTPAPTATADPLAPVRTALLRAAEAEAERLVAEARRDAATTLAAARSAAATTLREARHRGERDGARAASATLARARRTARAGLLEAQAAAYDELREEVLRRARQCWREASRAAVRERLTGLVRQALGPEATVTEHPRGGVVGTADGRCVDLSLDAVAGRVLDQAGAEVERLWRS